jgi:TRAP transporter TAXI family solute receptor
MLENTSTTKEDRFWRLSRKATFAVIAIVLLVSLVILKPAAPDKITLLTGPEGSGYHELGKRYAVYLEERGLEAEVKVTDGGFDNVKRLAAGADDIVAFAPSNIEHVVGDSVDTSHLVSLGSVAYEPLWLFYRAELPVRRITDLAGLRVAAGAKGSVVHYVARFLLELNGISDQVEIQPSEGQTPRTVAKALVDGQIDAAFAIGGPATPAIKDLLIDQDLGVLSFERADAYQALDPGITKLVAPQGIFDLANNIPPEDLVLLSATTNLITLDSFYPGAVPLLIGAAADVHDRQRIVTAGETFPSAQNVSLPLKPAARRYYEQGEKGLSKFLPYKVTRWLNHLGFVVLPLLALTVVLVKIVPLILKIRISIKLTGFFKRLEEVEKSHATGGDRPTLLAELDALDRASSTIFVPRSSLPNYIDFRQFLHDMRERVAGS